LWTPFARILPTATVVEHQEALRYCRLPTAIV
jgi:hypothetical protein